MNTSAQAADRTAPPAVEAPGGATRVAVVEDSPTLRRNLEQWLKRTPDLECVCCCATGDEALRVLPACRPDVVLMDIQMPGISGIGCAAQLKRLLPALHIVMLTVYEDTDSIFRALRAGACGYLLKRSPMPDVLQAIREIRSGGVPMTSAIARKMVEALQDPALEQPSAPPLTPREREVLECVVEGFSNREICAKLGISLSTVKAHLAHSFEKLHVRSRTGAAVIYRQQTSDSAPLGDSKATQP